MFFECHIRDGGCRPYDDKTGDRIIFEHIQIKRPITGVFGKFFDKPASQTAALTIGQNI